jgi:ribulose-phosphate 3-epimerase
LRRFIDKEKLGVEIDAHLMIDPVEALIPSFAEAGAGFITFHPEVCADVGAAITAIESAGCKAGLVYSPDIGLDGLEPWLDSIDMVLIMSVHPGFGGQTFITASLDKLRQARALIDASGHSVRLEVDGGITLDNVADVAAAGADTFVAGSTIYRSDDYKQTIAEMRRRIEAVRRG